jgi:hypothetical protein
LNLKTDGDVERLLAGSTNPEVAVGLLVHLNETLFDDARLEHVVMDFDQKLGLKFELGTLVAA